jgi:hypothetical protein
VYDFYHHHLHHRTLLWLLFQDVHVVLVVAVMLMIWMPCAWLAVLVAVSSA